MSDDELYARLGEHTTVCPDPLPAEGYLERCETWDAVNLALRAEIVRRGVAPPPWWPLAVFKPPTPVRRSLTGLYLYGCLLVLALAAGVMAGR